MNRVFAVVLLLGLFLSPILAAPHAAYAQDIRLIDVRSTTTDLRRGMVFEVQVKASEVNEHTTANLVFDGVEYIAPGGGGACRSDSGLFLGWIEGEDYPIARIACTVPVAIPKDIQRVELIAYQFRACANGAERCSLIRSTQQFTLQDEDFDKVGSDEASTIHDRIKDRVPSLQSLLNVLWPRVSTSGGSNASSSSGGGAQGTGSSGSGSSQSSEGSSEQSPPSPNPGGSVTAAECTGYADAWFRYVCQVWSEIQANCNGQVLPENRMQCLNSLPSLRDKPNSKEYMIGNAGMNYCANGICSRGLQCVGWAQGMYSAVRNDLPMSQNPFRRMGWPQDALGGARGVFEPLFTITPWDQCRRSARPGEIMWVIYSLHIGIAQFEDSAGTYYTLIDANTGTKSSAGWYRGEVDKRSLSATSSWRPTHCMIPKVK